MGCMVSCVYAGSDKTVTMQWSSIGPKYNVKAIESKVLIWFEGEKNMRNVSYERWLKSAGHSENPNANPQSLAGGPTFAHDPYPRPGNRKSNFNHGRELGSLLYISVCQGADGMPPFPRI